MRSLYNGLLIVLFLVGFQSAFAGFISMNVNETSALPSCEGTLHIDQSKLTHTPVIQLIFNHVENCSNVIVYNVAMGVSREYKLYHEFGQQTFGTTLTLDDSLYTNGSNKIEILVTSNSGKHTDHILFKFNVSQTNYEFPFLFITTGEKIDLPSCGGTLRLSESLNHRGKTQYNLIFDNVRYCSNFKFISVDNFIESDVSMKLQGSRGHYYGSFTIPSRMINWFMTDIRVVIKSNGGAHQDKVNIMIFALPF